MSEMARAKQAGKHKTLSEQTRDINQNPLFSQFLETITDKGFFNGVQPGSKDYMGRYQKAAEKFRYVDWKVDSKV